jgi:PAS domain S-box-containing protein
MAVEYQRTEVLYDLAMSIGTGVDLQATLRASLSALVDKLGLESASVYRLDQLQRGAYTLELIQSIPSDTGEVAERCEVVERLPARLTGSELAGLRKRLPLQERSADGGSCHFLEMPGFGFIVLLGSADGLAAGLVAALKPVLRKLTDACIASVAFESARESEARFRELAALLPETVCELDRSGKITFVNREGLETFGYSQEEFDAGLNVADMLAPEERKRAMDNIAQVLAASGSGGGEYIGLRKDGTMFPVMVYGNTRSRGGAPSGLRAIIVDITERKEAERRAEARARALTWLSKAAVGFAELPLDDDIYQFAAGRLRELVGKAIVVISSFEEGTEELTIRSVAGPADHLAVVKTVVGANLVGLTFKVGSEAARDGLPMGRVVELEGGLFEAVWGELPQDLCDRVERKLGLGHVYALGMAREGHLLGSAIILAYEGYPLRDHEIVEAFLSLTAVAMERRRAEEESRQRAEQLEALRQVGLEVSARLELDVLLELVVSRAVKLLRGDAGGLHLYRPDGDVLEWSVAVGPGMAPVGTVLGRGEGLSGRVWKTGEPLIVDDYQHWEGMAAAWEGYSLYGCVGVPVGWGGEFLGVLNVMRCGRSAFSSSDAALLSLFATHAASAIRNARLFEDARKRAERLAVVNRIASAVGTELRLDDLLQRVHQEVEAMFEADAVLIALYDEAAKELDFRIAVDEGAPYPRDREPLGDQWAGEVVREQRPLLIRNVQEEEERLPGPLQLWGTMKAPGSWLGAPMRVGEGVVGVISVQAYRPYAYGNEEELLLATVADQVAVAVRNARLYQAERRQRDLAEALEEAANAVNSTLEVEGVLDRILEQVARVVPGDAFNVMMIEGDQANVVRSLGYETRADREAVENAVLSLRDYPILGRMMETGEPKIIQDIRETTEWVSARPEEWRRSYVGVPIMAAGVPVGFLNADGARPHQFGEEDGRWLQAFATHAAAAIQNAKLFGNVRQQAAELEALQRVSFDLASSLDLTAVLDGIARSALDLVKARDCHIYLYDEETGDFSYGTALWDDGRVEPAVAAVRAHGLTATVAENGKPVIVSDAKNHPLYAGAEAASWGVRSIAGFPMKIGDRILGVFNIAFTEPHQFTEDEVRVLGVMADQAAIAVENAQLYERVQAHAEELERAVEQRTEQLQDQYARSEAILGSATDGIVVAGQDGEIVQTNAVAEAWLLHTLSPEDGERLRDAVRALATRAGERPEEVLELSGLDLELRAATVSHPVADGSDVVVSIHDVSHLKALDRMKTRFISSVSHELRTPLTTVQLYATLMRQNPAKVETYLDAIDPETDHLARLIDGIVQIARIDAGRLELNLRPVELGSVVEQVALAYLARGERRQVSVGHEVAEDGPVVLADSERIMEVLNNLVDNAVRYAEPGDEVVVRAGFDEGDGREWGTVTVADTGPGISEEELPQVFDRFFRGERAQREQISGTGLGLAIVNELVALHGGRVRVESKRGTGSEFTVWFPLAE